MRNLFFKITLIASFILATMSSCNEKLDQNDMFKGRDRVNKKGIYDKGLNNKKPVSIQIAEDMEKQQKKEGNVNSKKAIKKKKRKAEKARRKNNRKTFIKVKTTKGKATEEK